MSDEPSTLLVFGLTGVAMSILAMMFLIIIEILNLYGPIVAWFCVGFVSACVALVGYLFEKYN